MGFLVQKVTYGSMGAPPQQPTLGRPFLPNRDESFLTAAEMAPPRLAFPSLNTVAQLRPRAIQQAELHSTGDTGEAGLSGEGYDPPQPFTRRTRNQQAQLGRSICKQTQLSFPQWQWLSSKDSQTAPASAWIWAAYFNHTQVLPSYLG